MKHPPEGLGGARGVLHCRYVVSEGHDSSFPLNACCYLRPGADDFKPGFHLEEGELVKRRMCPSSRLEGATVTSRPESRKGRAALIHDTDWSSWLTASGVSGYPARHIQSR